MRKSRNLKSSWTKLPRGEHCLANGIVKLLRHRGPADLPRSFSACSGSYSSFRTKVAGLCSIEGALDIFRRGCLVEVFQRQAGLPHFRWESSASRILLCAQSCTICILSPHPEHQQTWCSQCRHACSVGTLVLKAHVGVFEFCTRRRRSWSVYSLHLFPAVITSPRSDIAQANATGGLPSVHED